MKASLFVVFFLLYTMGYSQRPVAIKNGKFFEYSGNQMMYGGASESEHFVINNLELVKEQFHYGLGRERFPALLEPKFQSVADAESKWKDTDRFLVAHKGGEVKAYSIADLTRHEVVNDVIDGDPVFAAYCILADLGAIYKRTYGDTVLTFAVSGYTYYDPGVWNGLDGFILWDRETESLWWPLIDRAVSGALKGVSLRKLEDSFWEDTTWGTIRTRYPSARVLISNQAFERPKSWKKYTDVTEIVKNYGN
ncbi:MAG TPA: DUF3179 domain-containing (seleno)protein [Eudoraea sp.]|nr:DUF3179 domain-containing (seleno)protein [Eudoraea sp.]